MVRSDLYVSPQILQRLVVLAAEALPVLEKQLMDPRGPGDIRVSPRPRPTPGALGVLPLTMEVWSSRGPRQVPSPLIGETEFREGLQLPMVPGNGGARGKPEPWLCSGLELQACAPLLDLSCHQLALGIPAFR